MAKFKVGDRVNDHGTWGKIIEILKKNASGEQLYGFAPESGPAKGHSYEILEGKLSANSCVSTNSVVANAKLPTVGDWVFIKKHIPFGYGGKKAKITKDWDGGEYIVEVPGMIGDIQLKMGDWEVANSASVSSNRIVANALAARVARNGYADTPSGKKRW